MASYIVELLKWTLAIIAGGGATGVVKSLTTISGGASSLRIDKMVNPIVTATATKASVGISLLAIAFPLIIGADIILLLMWALKNVGNKFLSSKTA